MADPLTITGCVLAFLVALALAVIFIPEKDPFVFEENE